VSPQIAFAVLKHYADAKPIEDASKIKMANARAWVETSFLQTNKDYVIDWASAVPRIQNGPPEFDNGSRDRAAYVKDHIADPNAKIASFVETDLQSTATCCKLDALHHLYMACSNAISPNNFPVQNDAFGGKGAGFINGIARVGLYNLRGLNQPRGQNSVEPYVFAIPMSIPSSAFYPTEMKCV
jgi:hypothetical protein